MSEQETVRVVHNEGADKPWEVSLEGVGLLGTARAVLNHPGRHFESQQEAIETAEKIKELIKADRLEVEGSSTSSESVPLVEEADETNGYPDPVRESVLTGQPSVETSDSSASEEYRAVAVDEDLNTPEPTIYQDHSEEDVSSSATPDASRSSFFGDHEPPSEVKHTGGLPPRP